ncbi:cardiolipin synthase [Poriferisphaera sp. WC338]|uniref:cardiolipin synthase n=1 Tax=Poriferisphaera sp. WC338 TaxID=3425129 RepID=UPI003D8154BA
MSWVTYYLIFDWALRLLMIMVVLRRQWLPSVKFSWLALVLFLPELGAVLYLLLAVNYLGWRRKREHKYVLGLTGAKVRAEHLQEKMPASNVEVRVEQRAMMLQAQSTSGNPIVGGSDIRFISSTKRYVELVCEDIDRATDHVHLLYYIFCDDDYGRQIINALIHARGRGVTCRLLVDAAGSRHFIKSPAFSELKRAGIEAEAVLPVSVLRHKFSRIDMRNHRKIAVMDGCVAYAGSHNVVVENYGSEKNQNWIDLSGRYEGPVVGQLQQVFLDDWLYQTQMELKEDGLFPKLADAGEMPAQVVPTGPNYEAETFRRVFIAALNSAQEKIVITTPYFVPDEPTALALSMAADRNVEVIVIVPAVNNHPLVKLAGEFYYDYLLASGIKIYQFSGGLLHSKTVTVDDAFGLLGSANIDIRSFHLNFEVNTLLYGAAVTRRLWEEQRMYLSYSAELDLATWRQRSTWRKYGESLASLFSPLL